MPPRHNLKRKNPESPVDPEESGKKRKVNNGETTAKEASPSPSSSDFSSDESENNFPVAPGDYVDYSVMYQAGEVETYSRPPRQQRWKHDGDVPITDSALVPEGWNADELDLNVNDIDGQIERCMERISDGILPDFFKLIQSEPAGLSLDVVRRLDHLKIIEAHLNTNGDPDNEIPNVKAIIKAYRAGKLAWSRGWVSYWSEGVQLNEPRKFDADYHKRLAETYDTTKAWWVEGLQDPAGSNIGGFHAFPPINGVHSIEFPVELSPNSQVDGFNSLTMYVCHDTGADIMAVPQYYLDQLEALGTRVPVHGYTVMSTPGAVACHKVVEIDVRVSDGAGQPLSHWMRVQACALINLPGINVGMLLSGPFLRFALYTATCPDGQGNLYVCNHKRELKRLPAVPHNFVPRGPPYVVTAPPAPDGGPPPFSVIAQQTHVFTTMPVQPPPLQPPQAPKKAKAKKGKKKGKKAAP
ncbi:uncharacterized protein N7500_003287 [Penicillium coprophilum]|uniref:uncharacterized protein n=1 Tax=Penicillium coprophilum TaxID=36646 RepID=UPI00238B8B5A|nr:uncharacterized protein N7500_003287 [Penicillium coprophilum]KAJ5170504.1 hypothetical protein N7500_003287 [Penicillium coprophilum]